ncbi:unnamed protein product [Agarophyton chilense]
MTEEGRSDVRSVNTSEYLLKNIEADLFTKRLDVLQRLEALAFTRLTDAPIELLLKPCSKRTEPHDKRSENDLERLGTSLLAEIGFEESILLSHAATYLKVAGIQFRKSAAFISRMVCTIDMYTPDTNGNTMSSSTHGRRVKFQPSSSPKTEKEYSIVLATLCAFFMRIVAIKISLSGDASENSQRERCGESVLSFRRVPFVVARKVTDRYKSLLHSIGERFETAVLHFNAQYRLTCIACQNLGWGTQPARWKETPLQNNEDRNYAEVRFSLERELDKRFHEVVKCILLQKLGHTASTYSLFVHSFLSVFCVTDDKRGMYRLRKAHEVSPTLAALLYCASSCGVLEACDVFETTEGGARIAKRQSEQIETMKFATANTIRNEFFGAGDIPIDGNTQIMTHDDIRSRYRQDKNNAVSFLREWMSTSILIQSSSKRNVRLSWCLQHKNCAFIDGRECSIDIVNNAVQNLQGELRQLLAKELLLGADMNTQLWTKLTNVNDDYCIVKAGENFLSATDNHELALETSRLIFFHLMDNKCLLHRFFDVEILQDGAYEKDVDDPLDVYAILQQCVRLGTPCIENYLRKCEEAKELALVLVHICGGSPARATEIGTYMFCNGESLSRSFFFKQGRVVFLAGYGKNEWRSVFETEVWRQVDAEISRLLLVLFQLLDLFKSFYYVLRSLLLQIKGYYTMSSAVQTESHSMPDASAPSLRNILLATVFRTPSVSTDIGNARW